MSGAISQRLDALLEHYIVACLFLAQVIMTFIGVGDVRTISILGFLLCIVGLAQKPVRADLRVLVPLILYNLISMISTFAVYRNITDGYGALQSLLPVFYLLMACLSSRELFVLKRLCVVWTGIVALCGICQFGWLAVVQNRTGRLGGLPGNPNALGIFLVIGWFVLMSCREEEKEKPDVLLCMLEPLLLIVLALTLSMGSFAAMAAGVLVLLAEKKRGSSREETFRYACALLAKAGLGIGTGILLYLAASRSGAPWVCLPLLLYGAAAVMLWQKFERFLSVFPRMAAMISVCGALIAISVVIIRPSAVSTFAERLEMMKSALYYITVNPALGVGPYQWRLLDMQDGGIYFNTWHIHNALLHVGVEMGWIAMLMLMAVAVRFYRKHPKPPVKAEITAFFIHNLIDTSFFYIGITSLALFTAGEPQGKQTKNPAARVVFGLFAFIFAWNLYYFVSAA